MQSFLDTIRRPVVHFDVKNAEHRMHMAMFIKNSTWSKCPYVFYAPHDISVKAYATQMLVEYYLSSEFPEQFESNESKKRVKTIRITDGKKVSEAPV